MGTMRQNARVELGDVPRQLAALDTMTVGELARKFEELYGEPTRSRNKTYLQKRLAWRIQELAEGGLSAQAIRRIQDLGDELPERWRQRLANPVPPARAAAAVRPGPEKRPSGLPPVGELLRREYDGEVHEVTVVADGIDYRGRRFRSLSQVAKQITGTHWNGRVFFGLPSRGKP
jgi:hypothetical protein